jgi:hypothetical protein
MTVEEWAVNLEATTVALKVTIWVKTAVILAVTERKAEISLSSHLSLVAIIRPSSASTSRRVTAPTPPDVHSLMASTS